MNILRIIFSLEAAILISYVIFGVGIVISFFSKSETAIPVLIGGILGFLEVISGTYFIYHGTAELDINYVFWIVVFMIIDIPIGFIKRWGIISEKTEKEDVASISKNESMETSKIDKEDFLQGVNEENENIAFDSIEKSQTKRMEDSNGN